ncbi:MAG: sigma-70 family RNA polymerase sigma factor [Lysobacteraceae bacterium]|nr:MAG: sigma-70 family RNA polymerase sigma factor [Xanthomonadaceae bacterium]
MSDSASTTVSTPVTSSVTELLERAKEGRTIAWNEIYAQLYRELYRLARAQLRRTFGHTLTPTSLLSETWLRLARKQDVMAENRRQLIGLMVSAMRKAILDEVRRRRTEKRGGHAHVEPLDEVDVGGESPQVEHLLSLDAALDELAELHPRLAQVVEWRYFGGMSEAEIAMALDVHVRTVRRDWQAARMFLLQRIGDGSVRTAADVC